MKARDILIALDTHFEGRWETIYEAIREKEVDILKDENVLLNINIMIYEILSEGYRFVTMVDSEYPESIKQTFRPPFVIHYKGKLEDIENKFMYSDYEYCPNYGCYLD